MAEIELNTKIYKKENLDISYSITDKRLLNGILHYKLKSVTSQEIFLSEFAIRDNFVSEDMMCKQSQNSVSRLFTKLINNGYKTGKTNEK
ncbi:hypothetical protein N8311_01460 [bacterium]|nr:hypothetical protein [bacterium]